MCCCDLASSTWLLVLKVKTAPESMDFEDPDFVNALCEVLRGLQEEGRWQQPKKVGSVNVNNLPKFVGGFNPKEYLDWEEIIEIFFKFKGLDDKMSCKNAIWGWMDKHWFGMKN